MKNTKGLSQVVTTVIFISLALIAIGIVWAVISNLINQGASGAEAQAKCLSVDVKATAVTGNSTAGYLVTLRRSAGGDEIAGVKMVIFAGTSAGELVDSADLTTAINNIEPLATVTTEAIDGPDDADKIEVTPYVTDDAGNDVACTTTTFSF